MSDVLLCCQERASQTIARFGLAQANKWAGFVHSAGSYTLVYTITTNTSIVTAVSSNSHAALSRKCTLAYIYVDKFSMLKYFRGQVDPRKYFNTKIYHTKILLHENFPIYGIYHSINTVNYPPFYKHDNSCSLKMHVQRFHYSLQQPQKRKA